MTAVIDVVMQVLLLVAFVGALSMAALGVWQLMPLEGRETLHGVVRRVARRRVTSRSDTPVYAVLMASCSMPVARRTCRRCWGPPSCWRVGRCCGWSTPTSRPRWYSAVGR